jgi:hypothetical protein
MTLYLDRGAPVEAGAPDDEINDEMMEAGCHEFLSFDPRFEDVSDVVRRIWRKMLASKIAERLSDDHVEEPAENP